MPYLTEYIEIDGTIYLDQVEAEFYLEESTHLLDPYLNGQSRGYETVVDSCDLKRLRLGDLWVDRSSAIKVFGEEAILKIEEHIAEDN